MNQYVPVVIAHRGASRAAPENTLAAFDLALDQGAGGIELDVHLSADGVPVVIHDFALDRTTDGSGAVGEHTVAQLRRLDAGAWFDPSFAGQRIPTLEETLDRLAGRTDRRVLVNVELKAGSTQYPGIERACAAILQQYATEVQLVVSSFDHRALTTLADQAPAIPTGVLHVARMVDTAAYARRVHAAAVHPLAATVDAQSVAEAHTADLAIYPWTVDDAAQVRRLAQLGVDGIITNLPDLARRALTTADAPD